MATELQKLGEGATRAALEHATTGLQLKEPGINTATTQLELIAKTSTGTFLHFASLERFDDYGAGASGALLIGVEDDDFQQITGDTNLQATLKSIDTAIDSLSAVSVGGFTQGSVLFADSGGNLDEDNSNFFWDNSNNRFALGTTNPIHVLHIKNNTPIILLEDADGGVDDKQLHISGAGGAFEINSRNDDNSIRTADIIVADLGTGDVGFGTNSPVSSFEISKPGGVATITLTNSDVTVSDQETIGTLDFYGTDGSTSAEGIVGRIRLKAEGSHTANNAKTYMAFHTNSGNAGTLNEGVRLESTGVLLGNYGFELGANADLLLSSTSDINCNSGDLYWDSADARLGLGTTNPSGALHAYGATGNLDIRVQTAGTDSIASLVLQNDARQWVTRVDGGNSDSYTIRDGTATADRLTIDTSGNILIPNGDLAIQGAGDVFFDLKGDSNNSGSNDDAIRYFTDDASTAKWAHGYDQSNSGKFVFSKDTNTLGTNDVLILDGSGVNIPASMDLLLSTTSDINVGSGNFTVAGASGDGFLAGTLEAQGNVTLLNSTSGDTLSLKFQYQTYDFTVGSLGYGLDIQGKGAGKGAEIALFTNDGDNTDNCNIELYGKGTPTAKTHSESLVMGYFQSVSRYGIYTQFSGTGVGRDLALHTEGNDDQLVLNTDGSISMSGDLTLSEDVTFLDNKKIILGTGGDSEILFDATKMVIRPDAVSGLGELVVAGVSVVDMKLYSSGVNSTPNLIWENDVQEFELGINSSDSLLLTDVTNGDGILSYSPGGRFYIARAVELNSQLLLNNITTTTASTTQTQGQGLLSSTVNDINVVANANDTVSLPAGTVGEQVIIANTGSNTLQVFPPASDSIGTGATNASVTIPSNSTAIFWKSTSSKWIMINA